MVLRRAGRLTSAWLLAALLLTAPDPAFATTPGQSSQVAIVATVDGVRQIEIHRLDLGISEPLVILDERDAVQPAWNADGSVLAYAAQTEPGGAFAIYTVGADGSNPTQITDPDAAVGPSQGDLNPTWSPDGSQIAFSRSEPTGTHIMISPAAGGDERRLTTDDAVEVEPSWSPEGDAIVFARTEPGCGDCTYGLAVGDPSAAGAAESLTSDPFLSLRDPDWSPDGESILAGVTFIDGYTTIGLVQVSTGFVLEFLPVGVADPVWSPDATRTAAEFGIGVLIVPRFDFGADFIENASDPAWRPDLLPPVVTLMIETDANGWNLGTPGIIEAFDPSGVFIHVRCTTDGAFTPTNTTSQTFDSLVAEVSLDVEGVHDLRCEVRDEPGNVTVVQTQVKVDTETPAVDPPAFDPDPTRVSSNESCSSTSIEGEWWVRGSQRASG